MALKNTVADMKKLLDCIAKDIDKACNGNRAASQRVRTCTIKFAKASKLYRKESVAEEKKGGKKKKPAKKAAKKKVAKKKPVKKVAKKKAAPKRRATAKVVRKAKKRRK